MKDENLGVPLSPKHAELLQKLVEVAEQTVSITVWVDQTQSPTIHDAWVITISSTHVDEAEHAERTEKTVKNVPGTPLYTLMALEYIYQGPTTNYVVLDYELAKKRVTYENKKKIGKWWMRTTNDLGDFTIKGAGILGGLWAIADIIRMIVEAV